MSAPDLTPNLPLKVEYDYRNDVISIGGVKYSCALFRLLALAEPGTWLRIESRSEDGIIDVYAPSPEEERALDAVTMRGRYRGATS